MVAVVLILSLAGNEYVLESWYADRISDTTCVEDIARLRKEAKDATLDLRCELSEVDTH